MRGSKNNVSVASMNMNGVAARRCALRQRTLGLAVP